ncbi:MAG: hypothetical protein AB1333_04445 [Patescibacteria group bacterium]
MKIFLIIKDYIAKNHEKEPWQIAAARYCVNNSENGFTQEELRNYIKSSYKVRDSHIGQFFREEISQPAGREHSRNFLNDGTINLWIPPLDLVSKVTDYDELKEARKNARQAFWLSLIAIVISGITLIISISK